MSKILNDEVDIAVIGGGPGGIGAAIRASQEGAKKVLLLERSEELGGMLPQCIHNGFGLHYFGEELTGPAYAYKLIKKVENEDVRVLTHTMVTKLEGTTITALSKKNVLKIKAKAVILSMGCRERARGAIMIPGDRPAGVFTAGTAQRLINIEGYLPGRRVVILGSGDIGMIMARRLSLEGAQVLCLVEILPFIGGLIRNEVQCLKDFNIPVFTSHCVTNIKGRNRVEQISIAKVDEQGQLVLGSEKVFNADTLLLSVGLIPENELSTKAGVLINSLTGGPIVNNLWQTNILGVYAGGNVVHVHDLADYVTESSENAASNAVRFLKGGPNRVPRNIQVSAGQNIRYVVPNRIVNADNVSFYFRVTKPMQDVTISLGSIMKKQVKFVRPSEQIRMDVLGRDINKEIEEIVVSCEGRDSLA